MTKKYYLAPEAELLMLVPDENLASGWIWGTSSPFPGAESKSVTTWENQWDFTQDKDSYQIHKD